MTQISDERVADLARKQSAYAKACRATGSPIAGQEADDIAAALRELELRRFTDAIARGEYEAPTSPERFVPSARLNSSPDILSKCQDCGAFLGRDHACLY